MGLCPLLKAECIREKCEWWLAARLENHAGCAVVILPDKTADISKRLDDMNYRLDCAFREINVNGERLIGNYTDDLKDIPEKE